MSENQIEWLMGGDPAIRWQVLNDLLDSSRSDVDAERRLVSETGWGRELIAVQGANGRWAADSGPEAFRGLYSPKWTSTTYTLLLLRRLGLDPESEAARLGCRAIVEGAHWTDDGDVRFWSSDTPDVAVCGIVCSILEYFDYNAPGRRDGLAAYLLNDQRPDGSWKGNSGPMADTISVLEALELRRRRHPDDELDAAMESAHEYLLQRNLFRSPDTGETLKPAFTRFSFPPRWHYDVLRALDHFQWASAATDERAAEAIELVIEKRRHDGTWPRQNPHPGLEHFQMEKPGGASRWNTLRALRVLRWWERSLRGRGKRRTEWCDSRNP